MRNALVFTNGESLVGYLEGKSWFEGLLYWVRTAAGYFRKGDGR
jgi:hypothetical protein